MEKTGHSPSAIFATLEKSGGPPLPGGFCLATMRLQTPLSLQPGQWLSASLPIALFQQPDPHTVQLILPDQAPNRLQLRVRGQPKPQPTQPALLISQSLPTLGGLLFAARQWRTSDTRMLAAIQLPQPTPFKPSPARIWLPHAPHEAIAAMPLMEDWHIPNRLASPDGHPGCFEGDALALADHLQYHSQEAYEKIIFKA